ncbi:MAG: hypothetical protein WBV33_11380 [Terracidiphilus sp.]
MPRMWIPSVAALLALAGIAGAQPDALKPSGNLGAVGAVQVKNVSISAFSVAHVEVGVTLMLVPSQSVTLKNFQICSLRLNGLPVFAAPLDQEIVLHSGQAMELPPISISIFFRDLTTTQPLREMIEKQSVHVQGDVESNVELGLLGKLALHSEHPKVVVPISQDVAVEVVGSPLERNLALSVLSAIDSQMESSGPADKLLDGLRPAWIRTIETAAQPSLYLVESSYSLSQGSTPYQVSAEALGFRTASGKIATSAEMLAPWKYDIEFQRALSSGAVKLVKQNEELTVRPITGSAAALSLAHGDISAEARGTPESDKLTAVGKTREQVEVLRRDSPSSLAVLTLRAPAAPGLTPAPASVLAQDNWEMVVVFRLRGAAGTGGRLVEPLPIAARREGDSIHLLQPVDDAVYGSPIVTPEGVIGIVQDEQTGTFLPPDLEGLQQPHQ